MSEPEESNKTALRGAGILFGLIFRLFGLIVAPFLVIHTVENGFEWWPIFWLLLCLHFIFRRV